MVMPDPCLMSRLFPPALAAIYEDAYKANGMTLIKTNKVFADHFEGKGNASAVVMKDGQKVEGEAFFVINIREFSFENASWDFWLLWFVFCIVPIMTNKMFD